MIIAASIANCKAFTFESTLAISRLDYSSAGHPADMRNGASTVPERKNQSLELRKSQR